MQPVTAADPQIPLDVLELRLEPLTREELEVEAQAWLGLLKAKVEEVSAAKIAVKYKREELDKAEEVREKLEAVQEAREADYWTVYWDVIRAVKERFDREGISIPYPQRDVHLYQSSPEQGPASS